MATLVPCLTGNDNAAAQTVAKEAISQAAGSAAASKPREIRITDAPIPMRILVQSPAETDTELQIICLFRSDPSNTLHGSLVEANEKLKGLLDRIRKPTLFRGDLGETLLIDPPSGSLAARRLLIIGLGDSETFVPERMELVGAIAYREASRLGVARPFFAPTVIDGGVTTSAAGQVAEQVIRGFLRAARTEKVVQEGGASRGPIIQELTFLAGPQHAADAQKGIENAIADAGK
ncbi:MAG: M17 family peptidase N-terminal domain-containing protein [Candidatus Sulfotelmatobacter sp.]